MPYITRAHESLPYIDREPTDEERAAAEALVAEERLRVPDDPYHALLRPPYEVKLTSAMRGEVDRVATQLSTADKSRQKLNAIDLSRYEAQSTATDSSKADLQTAIFRAYTSHTYLRGRRTNLSLLDNYGKNAWLLSNWHTENELRTMEAELFQNRRHIDITTDRRQRAQNEVAAELGGLESSWRSSVGRLLETEVAAEELRLKILDVQRKNAEELSVRAP